MTAARYSLAGVLEQAAADWPQLRGLRHGENQGKGAAVRSGVLASRGRLVLFADADGATPIAEETALAEAIAAGADVAVGSRLLAGASRRRHPFRALVGWMFAAVARRLLKLSIRDTQCGFKMFRGDAGRAIFSQVRQTRYLFDLEVLALADRLGLKTVEVPVQWREVPGGHFHIAVEFGRTCVDLWRLRQRLRREGAR